MNDRTYFIIGSENSQRRLILKGVFENGIMASEMCGIFISDTENTSGSERILEGRSNVKIFRYKSYDEVEEIASKNEFSYIFFLGDSMTNLADEVEKFKILCDKKVFKLIRVWGVVDCKLFERLGNKCFEYYDALVHFSDCILMTNRSGVSGKSVNMFMDRYKKMHYPQTFEFVMKDGSVENPEALMVDEARRTTMIFDDYDAIDELDLDEENLPEEPFSLVKKADPYLERSESGVRMKRVPDGKSLIEGIK